MRLKVTRTVVKGIDISADTLGRLYLIEYEDGDLEHVTIDEIDVIEEQDEQEGHCQGQVG